MTDDSEFSPNLGEQFEMTPVMWAWGLSEYLSESQGVAQHSVGWRQILAQDIMKAFKQNLRTLPLRMAASGLRLAAEDLPTNWDSQTILRKDELREWAKVHCLDMLGSALLAAAPAGAGTLPVGDDAKETPEGRRQRLQARCNEVKSSGVKAWQKQVAGEEKISTSRLKAILAGDVETPSKPEVKPFALVAAYGRKGK